MPPRGPGAKARRLAVELRRCRDEAGINLRQAAEEIGWDKSKLSRLETGRRNYTVEDVALLLGRYKVTGDRRERLLSIARSMHEPGWWDQGLQGLPSSTATLADYESEARRITQWSPLLMPGLLQTMEYARAWMHFDGIPHGHTELRLTARLRRQQVLTGDLEYAAFLGEPALRTPVGDHATLSRQLAALLDAAHRPNVTIRVVSADVGPHRGQLGAFDTLEFDTETAVVHVELTRSAIFMDDDTLTRPYLEAVTHLSAVGLNETESAKMIARVKEEVDRRWQT